MSQNFQGQTKKTIKLFALDKKIQRKFLSTYILPLNLFFVSFLLILPCFLCVNVIRCMWIEY